MLSQTSWTSLTLALTLLLQSADAAVMPPKQKAITGPLLKENLADPSIVKAKDGYYAFATEHHKPSKASRQGADNHVSRADDPNSEKKTNHTINISMAHSQQLDSGWKSVEGSAIHRLPKWAEHPDAQIWGPDVSQLANGSFVMYFSSVPASTADKGGKEHCIGVAYSDKVTGPYHPQDEPWLCPPNGQQGMNYFGADAIASDNSRYVVYTEENPTDNGSQDTIKLQEVDDKNEAKITGTPHELYHSQKEKSAKTGSSAPALVKHPKTNGYVLFYVTGSLEAHSQQIEYATSDTLTGNFAQQGILLKSGVYDGRNITAPGAPAFAQDSSTDMVFMANGNNPSGEREMYVAKLNYDGNKVSLDN